MATEHPDSSDRGDRSSTAERGESRSTIDSRTTATATRRPPRRTATRRASCGPSATRSTRWIRAVAAWPRSCGGALEVSAGRRWGRISHFSSRVERRTARARSGTRPQRIDYPESGIYRPKRVPSLEVDPAVPPERRESRLYRGDKSVDIIHEYPYPVVHLLSWYVRGWWNMLCGSERGRSPKRNPAESGSRGLEDEALERLRDDRTSTSVSEASTAIG